jgi:hypothetical protein
LKLFINAPGSQSFQQIPEATNSITVLSNSQPRTNVVPQTEAAKMDAAQMGNSVKPELIPAARSEVRMNAERRILATYKPVESRAERMQPPAAESRPFSDKTLREIEQKYLDTINLLARDVQASRSSVNSASLMSYEEAIGVVDRAIDNTRHAVREQPGDLVAMQYMMSAYEKKIELLKELARYQGRGSN